MFTPFGKQIRKYRIDKAQTLKEMADGLNIPSSYLSAVERGKKNVTSKLIQDIALWFGLNPAETHDLNQLAEHSKLSVRLNVTNLEDRSLELANAFAREFNNLDQKQIADLLSVLNNK